MKHNILHSYRHGQTNKFRERKVFSYLPFIMVRGIDGNFHWTGKWFQYVTIQEQKVIDWVLIKILNNK